MRSFLKVISYLFHPIFIPVMATIGYFLVTPRMYELYFKIDVSITIAIFTICIPMLIFILLKRFKMIDSIFLKDVKQRKIPLYIYVLILFFDRHKSNTKPIFAELYDFFLATLLSSIVCLLLVFFRVKASHAHDGNFRIGNVFSCVEYYVSGKHHVCFGYFNFNDWTRRNFTFVLKSTYIFGTYFWLFYWMYSAIGRAIRLVIRCKIVNQL